MFSLSVLLTVLGLVLFEVVSSIDNAIINAQVLTTMSQKAKRWFLFWGILSSVFLVRGLLPLMIIWAVNPSIGVVGAFTATFSNDPRVHLAIETAKPILLAGGGIFLVFLFCHWLFLEEKKFGIKGERFIFEQGVWFYAIVSIILTLVVWYALQINSLMAFGAVVGSTAFFITHGFKENAEKNEAELLSSNRSDISKILYLEVIDATFSIDGVLGAFAFTMSVPLILLGNGIGAVVVRQLTLGNIERVKKYVYLKNGAMYSVLGLGTVMLMEGFGVHVPAWISPILTLAIVGYFFLKSRNQNEKLN